MYLLVLGELRLEGLHVCGTCLVEGLVTQTHFLGMAVQGILSGHVGVRVGVRRGGLCRGIHILKLLDVIKKTVNVMQCVRLIVEELHNLVHTYKTTQYHEHNNKITYQRLQSGPPSGPWLQQQCQRSQCLRSCWRWHDQPGGPNRYQPTEKKRLNKQRGQWWQRK